MSVAEPRTLPVIPNPAQLAAYKWLLRYLFTDGDATPPPPSPLSPPGSRMAVVPRSAGKGARDATP